MQKCYACTSFAPSFEFIFAIRLLTVPLSKSVAVAIRIYNFPEPLSQSQALVLVERDLGRSGQLSWVEVQISGFSPVQLNDIAFLLTVLRSCYGLQYLSHRFIVCDAGRSIRDFHRVDTPTTTKIFELLAWNQSTFSGKESPAQVLDKLNFLEGFCVEIQILTPSIGEACISICMAKEGETEEKTENL
ncbi:MAG: hypothetical protein EZS28_007319 [Streblomastix strix]|uniref:Uncharacterized protein n=1 Tax=Streblomastix strix TaxID=222440 RepID=A0A5J4WQ52_9EUKA|nr:MAG: hypothetical protein EZS28_007319 [Streblomastix strix]